MKAFQLIQASALSAVLMLSAVPAFSAGLRNYSASRFGNTGHDEWRDNVDSRHDRRDDHWNDHRDNRWSDHGGRHDQRDNNWNGHDNNHHNNHWSDRGGWHDHRNDSQRDYGPGYYPGQRYMFPLYDGRPSNRHYPGYRERYYNGRYYYFNNTGFFFPGYGFIAYGHRHTRYCPQWHFEDFASGVILGAIISH